MKFSAGSKLTRLFSLAVLAGAGIGGHGTAAAHAVGLGWDVLGGGNVKFYLAHSHNNQSSPSEFLTIDGVNYNFTGIENDVPVRTGLEGALCNTSYVTCPGDGTMTANGANNDWLTVTISGLSNGSHTFTASPAGLSYWSIPSNNGTVTFQIVNAVPEPTSLALLGAGLLGFTLSGRKRKSAKIAG